MKADAAKRLFTRGALYWLPACAVAYLWIFVSGLVSDALSRWNLEIFAPGALVVVPALLMTPGRGFAVVAVSGFLFDGSLPVPFDKMETAFGGAERISLFGEMSVAVPSTMGFGAMWTAIFFFALRFFRSHVDPASPRHRLACALTVNFLIFLLWSCALGWGELGTPEFRLGFLAEAAASSAFIALAGGWFFDATLSLYRLCGADLIGERKAGEE